MPNYSGNVGAANWKASVTKGGGSFETSFDKPMGLAINFGHPVVVDSCKLGKEEIAPKVDGGVVYLRCRAGSVKMKVSWAEPESPAFDVSFWEGS